ncbi:MAG: cell wall-binding repeat-containing protein [Dehalobacter sp.]|nr:cell wall-binding repeat-containing protein [Dehalobacter sp.]
MSRTKKIAVLAIIAMVLTLMPAAMFAATADSTRLAGTDRIGTSLEIASAGWTTASTVILVPADQANLVDALAAAPLAGQENAPILLTGKTALDASVKAKIAALGATKVYVIGAISDAVVAEVNAISGVTATKLAGADRWATANAINAKLTSPAGTFVVGYNSLADALSVASYAAAKNFAIVLTKADGTVDSSKIVGSKTYLVGGTSVVKDYAGATRLAGTDRFDTNKAVVTTLDFEYGRVYVANGLSLVDALAASSLAANYNAPILLANGSSIPAGSSVSDKVGFVIALGGASAVSDSVINSLVPTGPIEVKSVQGVAGKSYTADDEDQTLAFTINGGRVVTIDQLDENGYTIEFQATENVLDDGYTSTTGALDTTNMDDFLNGAASDTFKYEVIISQEGQIVAQSDKVSATVIEGNATAASSITTLKFEITGAIANLTSNTLVQDETATISEVRANTVKGSKNVDITDAVTVTSSDPFVIDVQNDLDLYAAGAGTADITVTSGSVSKTVTFTVKASTGERKLTKVVAPVGTIKIAGTARDACPVIMYDQYGDTLDTTDATLYKIAATVSDPDTDDVIANIAAITAPVYPDKGQLLLTFTGQDVTGNGALKIQKPTGTTLATIDVYASTNDAVNSYKILAVGGDNADFSIDLNPEAAAVNVDEEVVLRVGTYNSAGYYCGDVLTDALETAVIDVDADNDLVLAVVNPTGKAILDTTITVNPNNTFTIQEGTAYLTGSATITANKYVLVGPTDKGKVASRTVTVKNTSPVITSVTFESSLDEISVASTDISEILQAKNIIVDGSAGDGVVRIGDGGEIYFDTDTTETYTPGDVIIGQLVAAKAGGTLTLGAPAFANGTLDVTAADGKITIGVKKMGASSPFKTITVDANV